jgi:hypothetical protein
MSRFFIDGSEVSRYEWLHQTPWIYRLPEIDWHTLLKPEVRATGTDPADCDVPGPAIGPRPG